MNTKRVQVNLRAFVQADDVFPTECDAGFTDHEILEAVFCALNAPFEFSPERYIHNVGGTCSQYHLDQYHKQYPSLSVGDEVVVGERRYRCGNVGWKDITTIGDLVRERRQS